ncbi:MAG: hypothetical protein AB7O45_09380 [Alphaproteobacteria bacterium]
MRVMLSVLAVAGIVAANAAAACEWSKAKTAQTPMPSKPVAEAPVTPKSGS